MPKHAFGKFLKLNISAEIMEDGSMVVAEERSAAFNGTFSGLYQWIYKQPGVEIVDVHVEEQGRFYKFNPGETYGPPGTYYIHDRPDRFFVDWSFAATDELRTFTLHYRVMNAVKVHNDVAELYYKFVGDEWSVATEDVSVRLLLPAGAQPQDIRAWGHGPLHGEVSIVSGREVTWQISPLPAETFLEGRVTFPPQLVPFAALQTGREALPAILAEEERWARQANRERFVNRALWAIAAFFLLGTSLFIYIM